MQQNKNSVPVDRRNHLLAFVHISHFPQKRKYTGEDYSVHLKAVADMADKFSLKMGYEIGLCHDLLEDTAVSFSELKEYLLRIGYSKEETDFIADGVFDLTDAYTTEYYPTLNRTKRKRLECERMSKISPNSQSIKYCDLIDNTKSIVQYDEGFAKVYLKEKLELLSVMGKGHSELLNMALKNITCNQEAK